MYSCQHFIVSVVVSKNTLDYLRFLVKVVVSKKRRVSTTADVLVPPPESPSSSKKPSPSQTVKTEIRTPSTRRSAARNRLVEYDDDSELAASVASEVVASLLQNWPCAYCGRSFENKKGLNKHMIHCPVRGSFANGQQQVAQTAVQSAPKSISDIADRLQKSQQTVNVPSTSDSSVKCVAKTEANASPDHKTPRKIMCLSCFKLCTRMRPDSKYCSACEQSCDLLSHEQNDHGEAPERKLRLRKRERSQSSIVSSDGSDMNPVFTCFVCQDEFSSRNDLMVHKHSACLPAECEDCGQMFRNKFECGQHKRTCNGYRVKRDGGKRRSNKSIKLNSSPVKLPEQREQFVPVSFGHLDHDYGQHAPVASSSRAQSQQALDDWTSQSEDDVTCLTSKKTSRSPAVKPPQLGDQASGSAARQDSSLQPIVDLVAAAAENAQREEFPGAVGELQDLDMSCRSI